MIVTAEPYYAVTMPSDLVVMQNVVVKDKTEGVIEHVNAHYTLLPRGAYAETAGRHAVIHPVTRDDRSPLELYEAVNAVNIAEAAGGSRYAADTMATARLALQNAKDMDTNKGGDRKQVITYSREAVQAAEDARIITIRKIKAEDEAAERKARADAELAAQQSQAAAAQQAEQRAQADAAPTRSAKQREQSARRRPTAGGAAGSAGLTPGRRNMRAKLKNQLNQVLQTTKRRAA